MWLYYLRFTRLVIINYFSEELLNDEEKRRHSILFCKAAKKPAAAALNPTPPPVETVVEEQNPEDRAEVPAMDDAYVPYGKSVRYARARNQKNDDHFRREVYIDVIDQISQELDNRFDEINMELLSCMSVFSPSKSFASFDAHKLPRLAEFYPNDFSNNNLVQLEL